MKKWREMRVWMDGDEVNGKVVEMRLSGKNYFFFFSSRRRHTRYIGDWSSDVCSSDLPLRCCFLPSMFSSWGF